MSRDDARRDANAFIAERIARNATPAQQQALVRDAERKGLIRQGEGRIVDGRMHSDTVAAIVGAQARRDDG
jgi:hypothetical protein